MGSLNLEGKPLPRRRTQRQEAHSLAQLDWLFPRRQNEGRRICCPCDDRRRVRARRTAAGHGRGDEAERRAGDGRGAAVDAHGANPVWKSTSESGSAPSRMRRRLKFDVHTGPADADRAPGGRALLHEPLLRRLLRALVGVRLAGPRGAAPELARGVDWLVAVYIAPRRRAERSSCRINLILHV